MKKLFITALVAVSFITSAFAYPANKVNLKIMNNFRSNFRNVSEVTWETAVDYAKATFVSNNIKTEAYFQLDGELIGSSRAITIDDLPLNAKRNFAKKYSGYRIKEAIEFTGVDETAYFLLVENDNTSLILKILNNEVSVYQNNKR